MKKYTLLILVLLLAVFIHKTAYSESVISNNVSVSASTGGNSASNGEVVEGGSHSSVFIETIIDGEVVEHIDEEVVSGEGSASVVVETSVTANGDEEPQVETNIEINTENVDEEIEEVASVVSSTAEVVSDTSTSSDDVVEEEKKGLINFLSKFIKYVFSIFT